MRRCSPAISLFTLGRPNVHDATLKRTWTRMNNDSADPRPAISDKRDEESVLRHRSSVSGRARSLKNLPSSVEEARRRYGPLIAAGGVRPLFSLLYLPDVSLSFFFFFHPRPERFSALLSTLCSPPCPPLHSPLGGTTELPVMIDKFNMVKAPSPFLAPPPPPPADPWSDV